MPKFGYAVFAGYFTACLLEFERNIISTRIWLYAGEPSFFFRENPWGTWQSFLITAVVLGVSSFFLGTIFASSWALLSASRDIQVSLFKLFLFAVIAMALIGGLHDYYIFTNNSIISESMRWLVFLPEFLVLASTIGYGLWLRRKGKTL